MIDDAVGRVADPDGWGGDGAAGEGIGAGGRALGGDGNVAAAAGCDAEQSGDGVRAAGLGERAVGVGVGDEDGVGLEDAAAQVVRPGVGRAKAGVAVERDGSAGLVEGAGRDCADEHVIGGEGRSRDGSANINGIDPAKAGADAERGRAGVREGRAVRDREQAGDVDRPGGSERAGVDGHGRRGIERERGGREEIDRAPGKDVERRLA